MTNDEKIIITDEMLQEYKDTCTKWEKVLQQLPVRAANDVLQHFTAVKKLRGKRRFGTISGKSEYSPFKKVKDSGSTVAIDFREIETFHANVIDEFAPVDYIDMPIAYDDPVIGEAIKRGGSTLMVLAQWAKARGEAIAQTAFTGKHNATGTTTADVCDGILTIADAEVEEGNLSSAKGNYMKVTEKVTNANAVDIVKEILFSSNSFLRNRDNVLLCSTQLADAYNEAYLLTHPAVVYNTAYNQPYVEGSRHKLTLMPLPELDGTDRAIMTDKANLLYGIYNDTDLTSVDIMRVGHYALSMASDIWLGFQIHTIDARRFRYVEFAGEDEQEKPTQNEKPSQNENQGDEEQGGE